MYVDMMIPLFFPIGKWTDGRTKNNSGMMVDLGMTEDEIWKVVERLCKDDSLSRSIDMVKVFLYYNEKSEKEKRRFREDVLRGEHRYTIKSLLKWFGYEFDKIQK